MAKFNDNLSNLMKQAQEMQVLMKDTQEQLGKLIVIGEAGNGMVKVHMNGHHDAVKVEIHASLMNDEAEMLEDLVAAAINDAVRKIEKTSKEKISQITAGLNIPSDFLDEEKE